MPLLAAQPDTDVAELYVLGGSRGGMQGTIAMRRGLPVRAATFRGGMFDLEASLAERPDLELDWGEIIPHWDTQGDAATEARSAIRWAGDLRVPILLVHGRQDWRVGVASVEAFAAALASAGVANKLVVYERDEHQIALHRAEWIAEAVAWFRAAR